MINIASIYLDYEETIQKFSEEKIRSRYENIHHEMSSFINNYDLKENLAIDEVALTHAVLDYFTDVARLKELHHISNIDDIKVYAYESFWLLKRHPIQIISNPDQEEKIVFANEKFVFSRLAKFMLDGRLDNTVDADKRQSILNFLDTLYYHLKFRDYNAQMLELFIMSFQAGILVGENRE